MPNKITAMIMYVLACAIQFAHSAIPHEHKNDIAHNHHHGNHDGHDHHDQGGQNHERSIFDIFSHFNHSAETFINYTQLSHVECAAILLLPCSESNVTFKVYDSPRASVKPPDIFISPHFLTRQFRGPPAV